jgi:hypothetical protein
MDVKGTTVFMKQMGFEMTQQFVLKIMIHKLKF